MTRPVVNMAQIEENIRKAAMQLIPLAANATWRRHVEGVENDLGESEATEEGEPLEPLEWSVSAFEIEFRGGRGQWKSEGRDERGRQRFLVAWPDGVAAADPAWVPAIGDEITIGESTWRVTGAKHQPVVLPSREYWEIEGERL